MKLETKVGAIFILSIFILSTLVLRMEKLEISSWRSQTQFVTEFDQVAGLNVKSAIRVAGVKVGTVTSIDLNGNRAKVTLELPKKFAINKNALVSLGSIGILGEKYIDLNPGSPEYGILPEGAIIPSKKSLSLDDLMETMGSISKDVKNVTATLNETIGSEGGKRQIDRIITNICQLTSEFRAIVNENHRSINSTTANLQQLSNDLKYELPKAVNTFSELGKNLNEITTQSKPELQTMITNIQKLTTRLQCTSDSILSITNKINKGEGTIGKLVNDESTINKINLTVDNVNSMLVNLKNLDLELDLNTANWSKRGEAAGGINIDLIPSHSYWYSFALNTTPDGKTNISNRDIFGRFQSTGQTTTTNDAFAQDGTTMTTNRAFAQDGTTMTTNRAFTVSAQFAKRLAEHFVLTGGMIENSGGGSVEFRSLNDKFRLGLIGYDFYKRNNKPKPRYRITSSYQFYKGAYVQMGMQDIANRKLRTFYFGGGLRWNDDDLKKIIGIASLSK